MSNARYPKSFPKTFLNDDVVTFNWAIFRHTWGSIIFNGIEPIKMFMCHITIWEKKNR